MPAVTCSINLPHVNKEREASNANRIRFSLSTFALLNYEYASFIKIKFGYKI